MMVEDIKKDFHNSLKEIQENTAKDLQVLKEKQKNTTKKLDPDLKAYLMMMVEDIKKDFNK